jgi:hypothetical protein
MPLASTCHPHSGLPPAECCFAREAAADERFATSGASVDWPLAHRALMAGDAAAQTVMSGVALKTRDAIAHIRP